MHFLAPPDSRSPSHQPRWDGQMTAERKLIERRLMCRKSDCRFFEFEYPWTSDTEFAHKIELKGSMSIQCSGSTTGIVRACHPAATPIAANGCLLFMYTQRAI